MRIKTILTLGAIVTALCKAHMASTKLLCKANVIYQNATSSAYRCIAMLPLFAICSHPSIPLQFEFYELVELVSKLVSYAFFTH